MNEVFDYFETRDDADELITEFGQDVILRRYTNTGSSFDPTLTPNDYLTKGARVEFTRRQLSGGLVLATDERFMIAAGPLAALGITDIRPSDFIVVNDVESKVGPLSKPIQPAATVVAFDVQAQK